jgi:cytochrome c-type biogenesis protein CcsB
MTTPKSPFIRWFQFLGKVQFTTFLLLGGVVIMAIGTVLESRGSREIAWDAVYGTAWFDLFLFLIAINLVIAVINRFPIRRHQWPFVLTHFAIVILLAGAWISRTYGFEGRMFIYEGDRENSIFLDDSEIQIRWTPSSGTASGGEVIEANFPLPQRGELAERILKEEGEGSPSIRIAEYIPDGVAKFELREGGAEDPPGIEFTLSSGEQQLQQWLIAGDPRFGRQDLRALEVEFRRIESSGVSGAPIGAGTTVRIALRDGSEAIPIPLPASVGVEVPIGTGLVARVQKYFERALVVDGKLSEGVTGEPNPAAIVEVRAENGSEIYTLFGLHPDFGTVTGRDLEQPLVETMRLDLPALPSKPRIAILLGPGGELYLQTSSPAGVSPAIPAVLGQSASLAGFGLRLDRFTANASAGNRVTPAPPGSTNGGKYVRLEAAANGMRQSVWLGYTGNFSELNLSGSGTLAAAFGGQTREVPFSIALKEFELIHYPGSNRPAEYRSRVWVDPSASGLPAHDAVVSMNKPLDVADFRLFQSSYKLGEAGGPDATIFSVAYDPGVPIVYASFFLLILGITWGLRGVSHKLEYPIHALATQPAKQAAPGGGIAHAAQEENAPPMRHASVRNLAVLFAMLVGFAATPDAWAQPAAPKAPISVESTRGWAIVADGRVKPLVTYAKEITLAITGRERIDGLSALEVLWGYSLNPNEFRDRPYVRVDGLELKAELGLPADQRRFAFNALVSKQSFQQLVDQALARQQRDQELSRLDDDALEAYGKLQRLAALASGEALMIVPIVDASGGWAAPIQLDGSANPGALAIREGFGRLVAAYTNGNAGAFDREAKALTPALRNLNPAIYPSESALARELFYEDFNAFGKSWVLYLAGFLAILLFGFSDRPWGYVAGMAFITAGFACHSVGLGIRWVIADRAPVSNMYESLVFMGWGAIAIGLIPEFVYRKRFLALAAGLMGFICLAFSENLPIDPAINPLVPVLAHTYWLSVHVMTVMLSYSAFAIAMVLGHVMLLVELVFRRQRVDLLTSLSKLLYKTLQVGILFLAAGIIFGAIWANESWGRYWGWDPKETWSLITFFVYLAIIHARFAGWLRHFGLAASAILGFLAVVMTYYGVNFILAAGMHAYGFSEGGQFWVAVYTAVEIIIIVAAWLRYGTVKALPSEPTNEPA